MPRILFSATISILLLYSCNTNEITEIRGYTMGTTYSIKAIDLNLGKELAKNKIDSILHAINLEMSTYIDSSQISKFNKISKGNKFYINKDFFKVITRAKIFNHLTNGLFEPTINPLVELWGFSKDGYLKEVPSETKIDSALSLVGLNNLIIHNDQSISKNRMISLDLSAIAKGYGVDKISEYLTENGCSDYMVEIGGEIRASGTNKDGKEWVAGLQRPNKNTGELAMRIKLKDISLATSGNYRNYYDIDGKRYSHIISPLTGYPIENDILSVSVLSKECIDADAFATSLILYSAEEGINFVENIDQVEVLYIMRDNSMIYSKGFSSYFNQN